MKKLFVALLAIVLMIQGFAVGEPTDGIKKYDEPITLTAARTSYTGELPAGEDLEHNPWMTAYEERLGIKLEYTITAPSDQYSQRIALAMASNDLPDIWISDKKNFYMALEAGLCYDLTDVYAEELSELSKLYMDEYELPFTAASVDGRLMAIPGLNEDPSTDADYTFIRHDWLEALGLDIPTTQQEMLDTLIAFAKEDPDGNGEDDTIALAITKNLWSSYYGLEGFFASYHAYPNIWYEQDGELVYGTVQAEPMKAALADLQMLYKEGAIDPEFIVKDSALVDEDIVTRKIGVAYGAWHMINGAMAKAFMADEEKVKDRWYCIDAVSIDDQPVYLQTSSSAPSTFYCVNANSEHPEALIRMVNLWWELMFSPTLTEEEYATYTNSVDGYNRQNLAFTSGLWPYVNPRMSNMIGVKDGTIDPATLTGESAAIWKNIDLFKKGEYPNSNVYAHYWSCSGEEYTSLDVRMRVIENKMTIENMDYGESTPTEVERMSTLNQLRDETITQIIIGEKSVDAFDEFVENWYALGGEDIVKEKNDWWDSVN